MSEEMGNPATETVDTVKPDGNEVNFIDGLPEDIRGNEALKGFADAGSLATAHLELLGKQPVVPEAYDFGDSPITAKGFVDKLTETFKANGLTQEQAAGVHGMFAEFEQAAMDKQTKTFEEWTLATKKQWPGAAMAENIAGAKAGIERFGGKDLLTFMEKTGMDKHPLVLKAFSTINKSISEDGFTRDGGTPPAKMARTDANNPMLGFHSMDKK